MKIFYGWIIVGIGIVVTCIGMGAMLTLGMALGPPVGGWLFDTYGGYSVVDVPSMKEAVAIALDHPLVRVGGHSIEVRPIRELPPQ